MPKIPYNKRKDGRCYKQIVIGVDENGKRKVKTFYDRDWRALDKPIAHIKIDKIKPVQIEHFADLYAKCVIASIKNLSCFLKRI